MSQMTLYVDDARTLYHPLRTYYFVMQYLAFHDNLLLILPLVSLTRRAYLQIVHWERTDRVVWLVGGYIQNLVY